MHCAAIAVTRCLSVRPSVTFVGCAKTNKDIFEMFSPSGSQSILVFPDQTGWRYSDGNPPNGGVECKGGIWRWNHPLSNARSTRRPHGWSSAIVTSSRQLLLTSVMRRFSRWSFLSAARRPSSDRVWRTVIVYYWSSSQPADRSIRPKPPFSVYWMTWSASSTKATSVRWCYWDLSAAFDTVDHSIFMEVLRWRLGVEGNALGWPAEFIMWPTTCGHIMKRCGCLSVCLSRVISRKRSQIEP